MTDPSAPELRRQTRFPVALQVWLETPDGEVEGVTETISRTGFSFRATCNIKDGETFRFALYLLDGSVVEGDAQCRSVLSEGLRGFEIEVDQACQSDWLKTVEWEEENGSLWRMVDRYTEADSSADHEQGDGRSVVMRIPRTQIDEQTEEAIEQSDATANHTQKLRFYTVGESGEAYRILFEKHPFDGGMESDLAIRIKGFSDLARRAVKRVLREPVTIRNDARNAAMEVRVAEMSRGGFAYVQGLESGTQVGLVSLALGELILIEVDDERVFPHFTDAELARIAKDAFRTEREREEFASDEQPPVTEVPSFGLEAVRRAQADAKKMEQRTYGDRTLTLFPEVMVRTVIGGAPLRGPTMMDPERDRLLLLALVGEGAPRVVPLDDRVPVALVADQNIDDSVS